MRKNWENEGERNERLMNTRKKQKRRTKSSEADEVVFVIPAGVKHEEKKINKTTKKSPQKYDKKRGQKETQIRNKKNHTFVLSKLNIFRCISVYQFLQEVVLKSKLTSQFRPVWYKNFLNLFLIF